jgi:hypothetical protein
MPNINSYTNGCTPYILIPVLVSVQPIQQPVQPVNGSCWGSCPNEQKPNTLICSWGQGHTSHHSGVENTCKATIAEHVTACSDDSTTNSKNGSSDVSSWTDVSSQSSYSGNDDWATMSKDSSNDTTDLSSQSSFGKARKQHSKRCTQGSQSWYNFVDLADLVTDIEANEHPYNWLAMLLKQKFPTTLNGKDIVEIPSRLSGCQSQNHSNESERKAYVAVSVAANPVMNAGRLALLFASKALAGQAFSMPEAVSKSDERLMVAIEFLKKVPRRRADINDLRDLSNSEIAEVRFAKQFWGGLCEKFKETNGASDPCSSLIAVPEDLLEIWTQIHSDTDQPCTRRFVMDVARWALRVSEHMEKNSDLELSLLVFPKPMIPVVSGKRAARAWMMDYFVKHEAVRSLLR